MQLTVLVCACLVVYTGADKALVMTPSMQIGFFETGDDVGAMNPHAYRPNEFVTNDMVFEGLTAWDPSSAGADGVNGTADDSVVGALAVSWTTNYDVVLANPEAPYEITFALRPGVRFHDGEAWDADAAALNFDHILGGPTRSFAGFHDWYGLASAIESWQAVDTLTFKVTFATYYESALRELSFIRPFRMSSPKALPSIGDGELSCSFWRSGVAFTTRDGRYVCRGIAAPIGTGPYRVVEKLLRTEAGASRLLPADAFNESCYVENRCVYEDGEHVAEVHFVKFAEHRFRPSYDRIIMRSYPSQAAIKAALLDGSLDMAYGLNTLSPSAFISIATQEGDELAAHTADFDLNTRLIVLNTAGALNTTALRKVVMGIIDRQPLFDGELAEEDPLDTLFPTQTPYCNIPLQSIKDLVKGTGATPSDIQQPLRFIYLKDVPHQNIIASKVIADLYTAGIAVTPLPVEKDEYNAAMNTWLGPDYDGVGGTISFDLAYSETWGPSYDATTKLFDMTYEWGSGEADAVATSNIENMPRSQLVSLIRSLSSTVDSTVRQDKYTQVLTALHNSAVFLPLTAKRNIAVVNRRVSGFRFGATEYDIPVAALHMTPPPPSEDDSLSAGAIAGIVIGSVAFILLMVVIVMLIVREKQGNPVFLPYKEPFQPDIETVATKTSPKSGTSGNPAPAERHTAL